MKRSIPRSARGAVVVQVPVVALRDVRGGASAIEYGLLVRAVSNDLHPDP
jgi:hypothetical protein